MKYFDEGTVKSRVGLIGSFVNRELFNSSKSCCRSAVRLVLIKYFSVKLLFYRKIVIFNRSTIIQNKKYSVSIAY